GTRQRRPRRSDASMAALSSVLGLRDELEGVVSPTASTTVVRASVLIAAGIGFPALFCPRCDCRPPARPGQATQDYAGARLADTLTPHVHDPRTKRPPVRLADEARAVDGRRAVAAGIEFA